MPVDPLHLVTLPLLAALAVLFLLAAAYDLVIFRRRKKSDSKAICRCSGCSRIYAVARYAPISHCPQCGKVNLPIRK